LLDGLSVTLEKNLDTYVSAILNKYEFRKVEHSKIIRDAVLGTHELSPLEVTIIDTPFVQRLRGINQTALAALTYPSATHNRFEHSLGVSIMAYRMGKALMDKGERIKRTTLAELRIAGLLHDIGHGPFSHASEEIIREVDEVKGILDEDSRFSKYKPHEMIGYKLLQTHSFKDFFAELLSSYHKTEISLDNISDMIIGSMHDKKNDQFKADIINGAFDADKLDYLTRDAYFTGIKMSIDVERIFATQMIDRRRRKTRRIIVDVGGVHILEQVLFNKMLLYPSVYHHHKVRSTVCLLESIFEMIRDNDLSLHGLKFDKVSDFLSVDDYFFLTSQNKPEKIATQIEKIKKRNLLKRALVISRKTVKRNLGRLLAEKDRPKNLRELAKRIAQDSKLKRKCEYYDIWVDLPENPRFPEPSQCLVRVTGKDYLHLDDFFPVTEWSESFAANKWKGYIFGPPDLQKTVADVTWSLFEERFEIKWDKQARILAKHSSDAG
jgi:HD superfamily phosphohydrolase